MRFTTAFKWYLTIYIKSNDCFFSCPFIHIPNLNCLLLLQRSRDISCFTRDRTPTYKKLPCTLCPTKIRQKDETVPNLDEAKNHLAAAPLTTKGNFTMKRVYTMCEIKLGICGEPGAYPFPAPCTDAGCHGMPRPVLHGMVVRKA